MRRTLCIDPSTTTMGVALVIDVPDLPILRSQINFKLHKRVGLVAHGRIKFKGDVDKRIGIVGEKVAELIEQYQATEIFCEDTSHVIQKGTRAKEGLAAIKVKIRALGKRLNIPVYWISPMTIKSQTTGNHLAEKAEIINSVLKIWGIESKDDNHADALAIAYTRIVFGDTIRHRVYLKEQDRKLRKRRPKRAKF